MEPQSASSTPTVTVEEMASTLLDITEADEAALGRAASVGLATFQDYASTYAMLGPTLARVRRSAGGRGSSADGQRQDARRP
jgi:hypothetical protein